MTRTKRLISALATGALLVGGLAAPASAHNVTLDQMYIANWDSGGINTAMWLSDEDHPGLVKITLKKKNAAGDWVNIATERATYYVGRGYMHTFDPVPGNKRCKARGVFTKKNHKKVTGTSKVIAC